MNINSNVYISGLPRSGSTVLGMMLNQHKDIFHAGESWYWGNLDPKNAICSCGIKKCNKLTTIGNSIIESPEILTIAGTVKKLDSILGIKEAKEVELNYGEINTTISGLEKLFELYRKVIGKGIILDKSNNIFLGREILLKDNWKVIFLLRDPRGVLNSNKKSADRYGNVFQLNSKIETIRNYTEALTEILLGNKNALIIKYEDLCNSPVEELKKICHYLNIEFNINMLNFREDKGHVLMANRVRLDNTTTLEEDLGWNNGLSKEEQEIILNQTDIISFYNKLGYNISL